MVQLAPVQAVSRWRLGHGPGFWVIAAAFTCSLAFSTLPTPLYGIYQQRDGFSTFMTTIIFAAYAVGVAASLYLAGHVSDWLGRRRVILAAVLAEALAAAVFLISSDLPSLLVARLICGAGIGALTATATAHLSELRAIARPAEDVGRSGLISTVVNMGGLALGPLVGGVFAQYVTSPLTVPFLVFLVLLLVAAIAVSLVPETVERLEELPAYRPQRVSLPKNALPLFSGAAISVFAAFAITGLFTALAPTVLVHSLNESSRLVSGVTVFALMVSAATAQVVFAPVARRTQLKLGLTLMATGLVVIPASVLLSGFWLFLLGGVLAGAGVGLGFRAAVGTVAALADPSSRGEVLAALFLAAYVGLIIPVIAVGLALVWLPIPVALTLFSLLELGLLAWSARRVLAGV